jgi:hypothetical protein
MDTWEILEHEFYEYSGRLALCDRSGVDEAKSAEASAANMASQYGAQAQSERAPVQRYDMANLLNPQGFGQQGVNQMLTAALGGAGGESASEVGSEQLSAQRGNTGANSASMDQIARERAKAGASASEGISAADVQAKLGQQQAAAQDLSSRYGIDVGAQQGEQGLQTDDINAQVNAGKSGWFQNTMQGIGTVSEAFKNVMQGLSACPVKGSLYLMADGTEKKVEQLFIGDSILGIDDEPETVLQIDINPGYVIELVLANGIKIKNSYCHALALPNGGFTVASKSSGKTVATKFGNSKVVSIIPAGREDVYNVITDGSHTFRADGVWAYGVGEGELTVTLEQWDAIADRLIADFTVAGGK